MGEGSSFHVQAKSEILSGGERGGVIHLSMSRPNLKYWVRVGFGWSSFHVQAKSEIVSEGEGEGGQSSFHVQTKSEIVIEGGGGSVIFPCPGQI